jgi:hypothetical protein
MGDFNENPDDRGLYRNYDPKKGQNPLKQRNC